MITFSSIVSTFTFNSLCAIASRIRLSRLGSRTKRSFISNKPPNKLVGESAFHTRCCRIVSALRRIEALGLNLGIECFTDQVQVQQRFAQHGQLRGYPQSVITRNLRDFQDDSPHLNLVHFRPLKLAYQTCHALAEWIL